MPEVGTVGSVISLVEGLSIATLLTVAFGVWNIIRNRKIDMAAHDQEIVERTKARLDLEHRVDSLEKEFNDHKKEGADLMAKVDSLHDEMIEIKTMLKNKGI